MKSNIKANLDSLQLSDVYSLMFFLLYKLQDTPEYATLSEMCYLLDAGNMTRLLTYFAGKTITIPKQEEFVILVNALLLYQRVNIKGESLVDAQAKATKDACDAQKIRWRRYSYLYKEQDIEINRLLCTNADLY